MIIYNLNVLRLVTGPFEANAPLVIDADAILSRSVTLEFFQPVAWRCRQISQIFGVIQINQLSTSRALHVFRQLLGSLADEDFLGFVRGERLDHDLIISRSDNIFKYWNARGKLTVCVISMCLFGTWHRRILGEISSPGTRKGWERLGCPLAGMGTISV